jgi:hypothetical protein
MFAMYFYHQWVMGEETIKGNVPSCSFSMIPVHSSSSAQQLQLSFELLAVAVPGALPCLYELLGQHDIQPMQPLSPTGSTKRACTCHFTGHHLYP